MPYLSRALALLATSLLILSTEFASGQPQAMLHSWNDRPAKQAIIDFVGAVCDTKGPDYVLPAERIAVFDNDGTLWSEKPIYFQFLFLRDRLQTQLNKHPQWRQTQPFQAALESDWKTFFSSEHTWFPVLHAAYAETSTEEISRIVKQWIATTKHPHLPRYYTELTFQPMLELLTYLQAHGFKNYIVSGGDIEFMRPWMAEVYGIPPERIVGSFFPTQLESSGGTAKLKRHFEPYFFNNGSNKPVAIERHIGRRPLAAFGNSDGDLQMLEWVAAGPGKRLCLFVHHTDEEREWAYDEGLSDGLKKARHKGWVVADMKRDWKVVFPFELPPPAKAR